MLRFLGRCCLEIKTLQDHFVIDPHYFEHPMEGIEAIFITHGHDDHFDLEKIKEIKDKYRNKEEDLTIYGSKNLEIEGDDLEIEEIKEEKQIELDNTVITPYRVKCYKAEDCYAYLITFGDINVLHTADSAEFSEKLRKIKQKIDYCFVACFEDNLDDYLDFLKEVHPKVVFPYHFSPGEEESAKKLVEFLNENTIEASFLEIGAEFEF